MSLQKEYWTNEYLKQPFEKPEYDLWLEKYRDILDESKGTAIIDLGCGRGNNSFYLTERGYKVISCDMSDLAVERVEKFVLKAETIIFDMLDGLPFKSDSAGIIIADLCLHYFTWADTVKIQQEIRRVLKKGGYLLLRVNSTNDINYGAGQGNKIEDNYYEVDGNNKRFFDRNHIEKLFSDSNNKEKLYPDRNEIEKGFSDNSEIVKGFSDHNEAVKAFSEWDLLYVDECQMDRYKMPKLLWEVVVMKR